MTKRLLTTPIQFSIFILFCAHIQLATALSTDKNQDIEIESNSVYLDDTKNVGVYSGNVVVLQGSIRITGDELTVYYTPLPPIAGSGKGLELNGADEYAVIPADPALDIKNEITVSAWVNSAASGQVGPIVAKQYDGYASIPFMLRILSNDRFNFVRQSLLDHDHTHFARIGRCQ